MFMIIASLTNFKKSKLHNVTNNCRITLKCWDSLWSSSSQNLSFIISETVLIILHMCCKNLFSYLSRGLVKSLKLSCDIVAASCRVGPVVMLPSWCLWNCNGILSLASCKRFSGNSGSTSSYFFTNNPCHFIQTILSFSKFGVPPEGRVTYLRGKKYYFLFSYLFTMII